MVNLIDSMKHLFESVADNPDQSLSQLMSLITIDADEVDDDSITRMHF